MALGDYKEELLPFSDLTAIADFYIYAHYPEPGPLSPKPPDVTWAAIAKERKEIDEFYNILILCIHLQHERYLYEHDLTLKTATKIIMDYYEKNKSLDYRVRRKIPENER